MSKVGKPSKHSSIRLTILYSSLGKLPVFHLSISWTFGLSNSLRILNIFLCTSFSCPLVGQIRFYLVHWLDEYTLGSFFFVLSLLRKAHRHYIPASRDFYSSLGLSLFVNEIMKRIYISHVFENSNHIHNINIVHKYGTCLEVSALFIQTSKFMTSSIVNLKLIHSQGIKI